MTEPSFAILHAAPEAAWGYAEGALLTYWALGMTPAIAERYMDDVRRLQLRAKPGTLGVGLTLVAERAQLPSQEVRAILAREPPDTRIVPVGTAIVFEGEGFRASVVRAIVAGFAFLNRRRDPFHAFASLPEAIDYLERRARVAGGVIAPREVLISGMDTLRMACVSAAR